MSLLMSSGVTRILQYGPTKRWLLDRLLPPLSDCRLETVVLLALADDAFQAEFVR